jgi:hypothetical protein
MNKKTIAGFSALFFWVALPASATVVETASTRQSAATKLSPASLVSMAYRGQFSQQGIPAMQGFHLSTQWGRSTLRNLSELLQR